MSIATRSASSSSYSPIQIPSLFINKLRGRSEQLFIVLRLGGSCLYTEFHDGCRPSMSENVDSICRVLAKGLSFFVHESSSRPAQRVLRTRFRHSQSKSSVVSVFVPRTLPFCVDALMHSFQHSLPSTLSPTLPPRHTLAPVRLSRPPFSIVHGVFFATRTEQCVDFLKAFCESALGEHTARECCRRLWK